MARLLNEKERDEFLLNRDNLHYQLSELQADLEDMTDEELIEVRDVMLERVNACMSLILETDEDNVEGN